MLYKYLNKKDVFDNVDLEPKIAEGAKFIKQKLLSVTRCLKNCRA